ncbi:MAG TPA: hypothetical protein DHS57_05830 [Erysipelotrichaceae bacterium]|jgi:GntR family transcriptional regulator|nr:GntR family transcriptional regulator [Erysipelotrichaceae bacterium]HCY06777.1 hypothetical protein [Erysipelotrichaceae bacterium]
MVIKKSDQKAYVQVRNDILYKIKNDIYKIGDQLPTNMQLCEIYDVSRITINRALYELEKDGYIEKHQGKGVFVVFKEIKQSINSFYTFTEEIKKMGYIPASIFLSLNLIEPKEEVINALDLDKNEKVYLIERLRLADDKIMAFDRSYIPERLIPNFQKTMLTGGSLYNALRDNYGFVPNRSEETVEAIIISDEDALKMKVKQGNPMLLVKRVSYLDNEKIEFNYRIVNSEIFKYKMSLK